MQQFFELSTQFVLRENDEETVSIEYVDKDNGVYELSDGTTVVHSQLIQNYVPLALMTESLYDKQITGGDRTTDGALKAQIEKQKQNFGLDLVTDASQLEHVVKREEPEQMVSNGFDFSKSTEEATFIYTPPSQNRSNITEMVETDSSYKPVRKTFDGDVLFESFKKMNTEDGNKIDIGSVVLNIPTKEQINQFKTLFNVDDTKIKEYIKDFLNDPETIETITESIAEKLSN